MGQVGKEVSPLLRGRIAKTHSCRFRGYPLNKIQENNESEIMQTILDDARESYAEEIVVELKSENSEDLESNVARIVSWIEAWVKDRRGS